jgi:hypothetical protein
MYEYVEIELPAQHQNKFEKCSYKFGILEFKGQSLLEI